MRNVEVHVTNSSPMETAILSHAQGESLAGYMSDGFRSLVDRDWARIIRKTEGEAK
jgi:hypothetical protein